MPLINFRNILSCSSEDRIHCSENLLKPEQYKKWLSSKGNEERLTCIIEFEKSSFISSIDIGNDGCAFVELFVSRSSSSKSDDWTVLLPATLLMTPSESRSNTNRNQVKLLKSNDLNKMCLNEKWDRLKIVCEQKFNRSNPFGLCFIKLYSPSTSSDENDRPTSMNKSSVLLNDDDDDETEKEQNKIGSFFAKKQAEKTLKNLKPSPSDEIRALSNVADELLSRKSMNDNEIQILLKKDIQKTPKRRISDQFQSSSNQSETKRNKTTDKSQIMKNVVFVLSGFENPLRSDLRNKATKMGAVYNDDWDKTCSHLICAFPNTPKFTQVKQLKQGFIVNKKWILDCYEQNQFLSEKNYQLTSSNVKSKETSIKKKIETFDDEDEDEFVVPKNVQRTKKEIETFDDEDEDDSVYNAETDEDEQNDEKPFELSNFFHKKHFYVFENDFDDETIRDIRRIIYAYDGIFEKQLTSDVNYIISNRTWNDEFEKATNTNPEMKFLSLDWLQDCHDENKFLPCQPYLILP